MGKKVTIQLLALALLVSIVLGGTGVGAFADTMDSNPKKTGSVPAEDADIATFPDEILRMVNEERSKRGLSTVEAGERLTAAAQMRAEELETEYGHTRPDGREWHTVWSDAGCTLRPKSENIARGIASPEDMMDAWMNSEGHRGNILEPGLKYAGVAVHQKADGSLCWVQLFSKGW